MHKTHIDDMLQQTREKVLRLYSMVDEALVQSVKCFVQKDKSGAQTVIKKDAAINALRYEIEGNLEQIIITQHPMARDAREIFALIHVIVDLERIGDYAKGIAV